MFRLSTISILPEVLRGVWCVAVLSEGLEEGRMEERWGVIVAVMAGFESTCKADGTVEMNC